MGFHFFETRDAKLPPSPQSGSGVYNVGLREERSIVDIAGYLAVPLPAAWNSRIYQPATRGLFHAGNLCTSTSSSSPDMTTFR